ncbi:MAG: PAS domain S-box protein [Syntrophales bacterium]|jgi:PAS domain S-box-containing protein
MKQLRKSASDRDMEKFFQEDKALFTKLYFTIPDAVILTDLRGKIIFVNDVAIKLGGYSNAKKIIGKDALSFISPQYREKAKINLARLLNDLPRPLTVYANDYALIAADGSHISLRFM